MFAVRRVAREEGIIIVASIHQPSLETCKQFTDLLLLTGGEICYNGPMEDLDGFLTSFGKPVGKFVSSFYPSSPRFPLLLKLDADYLPFLLFSVLR